MSDGPDIVQRLRDDWCGSSAYDLCREAAAEIERLRARVDNVERNETMLRLRMDGAGYKVIAERFGVSTPRARGIVVALAAARGITLGLHGGVLQVEA